MLLTYSIIKAKRALCDVAQFVADHNILTTVMTRTVVDRVQTTLNHIRFVFYCNIKNNEINIFLDYWKHRLRLEIARATLCKWAACARQTFLSKTFTNSLNMQKQYEKNVWETSNDTYSLSVRVQTTINHISICFLPQYQRQRKRLFFRARAEKGIAWHTDASSVVLRD